MGIKVLPPDVNKSLSEFSVEGDCIRYALAAIKSVGAANMDAIVKEREAKGEFKDISDFIHRIDAKQINRRQLEQLIKAGAFDSIDKARGKLFGNIDLITSHISASTELKNSAQNSLFGVEELQSKVTLNEKADWPELEKLRLESEAIGFYLSAHPLDSYQKGMERLGVKKYVDVMQGLRVGDSLRSKLAGCVNSFQKRISKNGNKYAFLEMSDGSSNFEGLLFAEGLSKYEDVINSGAPLLISVTIDKKEDDASPRMMINTVETLDQAISEVANGLEVFINDVSAVSELHKVLSRDRNGKNKIYIKPESNDWDIRIALKDSFALYGDILSQIRAIPGISRVKEI